MEGEQIVRVVQADDYVINSFILHELAFDEVVVQTDQSIVRIHNEQLQKVIYDWDTKAGSTFNSDALRSTFGDSYNDLLEFLEINHIIKKQVKPNFSLNSIQFITNNSVVFDMFHHIFDDYRTEMKCTYTYVESLDEATIEIAEDQLLVLFLNPYNKSFMVKLRDQVKNYDNVHTLCAYTYNGIFYMDALYNARLKSPCHVCHISSIETSIRNQDLSNVTYQHIIDSIYLEESLFDVHMPLTKLNALTVVNLIGNRIEKLIMNHANKEVAIEHFLQCISYKFHNQELCVDFPIHWELCDCYE